MGTWDSTGQPPLDRPSRPRRPASAPLLLGLIGAGFLPRCECEEEPGIGRAEVELRLTFNDVDPCSGASIPRRVPDDYASRVAATDFGSRGRRIFELRSVGTGPLVVQSIELSPGDDEFQVVVKDGRDMTPTFPLTLAGNPDVAAAPSLVIDVDYASLDSESDLVELVVKTDDPDRKEVRFGLTAGRGRIEACVGDKCGAAAAIAFGDVPKDESATETLVLKNVGEGQLDLRDIRLTSGSAEFCAETATQLPEGVEDCALRDLCRVLLPGETYEVPVEYRPVDKSADEGSIVIVSGDAQAGNVVVPIGGRGAGPDLTVCLVEGDQCVATTVIDFGVVELGQTAKKTVRVRSTGTLPVDLAEADLETTPNHPFVTGPDFTISRMFTKGMLEPGQEVEGEITYAPLSSGEHRGGFRFGAPNARIRGWIGLRGRSAVCDLEAVPKTVQFGTVAQGSSVDRDITLTSIGAGDCDVVNLGLPGGNFSLVNPPTLPARVPSGQVLKLTARYSAPMTGAPMSETETLEITSNEPAPNAVNSVRLVATGGGVGQCELNVQPTGNSVSRDGQLTFGAVSIGYKKMLPVRVTNIGNTNCSLDGFMLTTQAPATDMSAATAQALPWAIPPGVTVTVDVTFSPTGPANSLLGFYGPLQNYITVRVSGPGLAKTSYDIGINGRPTIPTIDVLPDAIDFGLVTWDAASPGQRSSCGSESRAVRIYNSGTGSLDVTAVRIDPSSDPEFIVESVRYGGGPLNPPYAMQIAPGDSAEVRVRFYPTRIVPSVHNGLLVIENSVTTETTVPLVGEGTANSAQTDSYSQLRDNKVDILWVVDDSCSMSEEQAALGQNFGSFIGFADSLNVDYQIGVITTEIYDPPAGKIWGCGGLPKIIRSSDPPATREQAFECATAVTNPPGANQRPNPTGSDEAEAGLQAARIALEPPVRDAENAGFLRDDARLAVIVVSDEEDQSPGSVNLYIDFFRNIKGFRNPQLVQLSAIAGDVPSGCATAAAGARYADAARQLGGQFESICTGSWAAMLQNMGLGIFALREAWGLTRLADGGSVTVRVDGQVIAEDPMNGWSYDAASNTVNFNGASVPEPGANIEISYGALCNP